MTWIGGANVPTTGGVRVNASIPLPELLLYGDTIELRLRGPLAKLARSAVLRAKPADLDSVFPIRSNVRFHGVRFRRPDGREYYFKTTAIDLVLDALRVPGFGGSATREEDLAPGPVELHRLRVRRA
jgi:hypothetical protein